MSYFNKSVAKLHYFGKMSFNKSERYKLPQQPNLFFDFFIINFMKSKF